MAEKQKRLTTEETWATALAVIGGLAVLIPLIVFALSSRDAERTADASPTEVAKIQPEDGSTARPRVSDLPIPKTATELRKELVDARKRIDALGDELAVVRTVAEANERSAERAWIQLREAAGEPEKAPGREDAGSGSREL